MDESTFLPPIVQLVARDGKGIAELADAVERHRAYLSQHGRLERRRNERLRRQVRAIITGRLGEWAHAKLTNDVEAGENLADLYRRKTDPHTVAAAVLRELGID
jgi:LAO/AO transport system kinase